MTSLPPAGAAPARAAAMPFIMLAVLIDMVNTSSGRSGSTDNKYPNFILPGTYDSGFALALMLKDMKIATDLAAKVGAPALLGEQAVERVGQLAPHEPVPVSDHVVDHAYPRVSGPFAGQGQRRPSPGRVPRHV